MGFSFGPHPPPPPPPPLCLAEYYKLSFWITLFRWVLKKLYPFESYPVFGDLRGFRGIFRPNHNELAIVQGTILFISSRTTIFVFESLDFVEYWQSYERLKFVQPSFRRPPRLSRRFPAKPQWVSYRERYHSLRLFEKYNFHFWITWFRWVLTKLWAFKVCLTFRPKSGLPFRLAPLSSNHTKPFGPYTNKQCIWKENEH